MSAEASSKAQLGLGHAYSRAKVKFNVHKSDNMIIQSIALLDQLDKDVNTFSMRIREWYSYHFPELVKIVPDNYTFAKCVKVIKNRKELSEEAIAALEEVVMDSAKAKAVVDASKTSMGMDISQVDLMNIDMFANRVVALAEYRKELAKYLQDKMGNVAPNLAALIGDTVGARLISHAGSLTNLAKYPASTVQILGAEKALFRALKKKGNTPKYGLIFHSSFIGRAAAKNKVSKINIWMQVCKKKRVHISILITGTYFSISGKQMLYCLKNWLLFRIFDQRFRIQTQGASWRSSQVFWNWRYPQKESGCYDGSCGEFEKRRVGVPNSEQQERKEKEET